MPTHTTDNYVGEEGTPAKPCPYIEKTKLYEIDTPGNDLDNRHLICEGEGIEGFFNVIRELASLPTHIYRYRLYFELSDGNEIDILPRTEHAGDPENDPRNYQMMIASWYPLA